MRPMADASTTGERPVSGICPWCSGALTPDATVCPTCGANLVADGDPNVPGVTAIDAASLVRSKAPPQSRNRLLSWISGEYQPDLPSKAESHAIAPPDDEVRREILRLELEAQVANLQAEADAIRAEAVAEGRTIDLPDLGAIAGEETGEAGAEGSADETSADETSADAPSAAPASAAAADQAATSPTAVAQDAEEPASPSDPGAVPPSA